MGRHRKLPTFPISMNASPDNGRVSLHQHVGIGVSIKTLQWAFSLNTCRRPAVITWRNMMCERGVDVVVPLHNGLLSKLIVLVVFISINLTVCDCERITPERCLIWGPGLNPDVVLPVRYFIIQAVNSKGENLTLSPGKLSTKTVTLQKCHCVKHTPLLTLANLQHHFSTSHWFENM